MRNNNSGVIRMLADTMYRADKRRNRILTGAVAFTVMALFCVFSIAVGKISTDCLLYMRSAGTAACTVLERPTKEQKEQICSLPYIRAAGLSVVIGYAGEYSGQVLDETAWSQMQAPAYSDIQGRYPEAEDEIMLPMRALEKIGITDPDIDMEIPVEMTLIDGELIRETFRLSGYYTEYVDPAASLPEGYFSQNYLSSLPEQVRTAAEDNGMLLIRQNDSIQEEEIEAMLYRDVTMRDDSQQFTGGNPMTWQAVYELTGGVDYAVLIGLVILAAAWLLLYNVIYISLNRDIRQYGMLMTLGTTDRQLRSIVLRQTAGTVFYGCLTGAAAGVVLTVSVIPRLLSGMYLTGMGSASAMIAFRPVLLLGAVVFGAAVTFLSALCALRRALRMNPAEAVRYTGVRMKRRRRKQGFGDVKKEKCLQTWRQQADRKPTGRKQTGRERQESNGKSRPEIPRMAWKNLFRFRKRFFITVVSVVLGITLSLSAVMISAGTDRRNKIMQQAAFKVSSNMNAMAVEGYPEDRTFFPADMAERITALQGVTESRRAEGGYGRISLNQDALRVIKDEMGGAAGNRTFVVQAMSEEWLDELERYAGEHEMRQYIDLEQVRAGEGALILHYGVLSQIQTEKGRQNVGKKLTLMDLDGQNPREMIFSGYLDQTKKDLPKFVTTAMGPGILYFLVSEDGFRKLELTEQIFAVELEVEDEYEPRIQAALTRMVSDYNREQDTMVQNGYIEDVEGLSLTSRSDTLRAEQDSILSGRLVMGALCLLLVMMGLVNYMNVTMTGLAVRRKELEVMECIGMTGRQIRGMLVCEGMFYSLIIAALTITVGSGIIRGTGILMKQRIPYFVYHFPVAEMALVLGCVFLICIAAPILMYGKMETLKNKRNTGK